MPAAASPIPALGLMTSAAIVSVAGLATLAVVETGPLSLQMVLHLGVMNVVAPLIAAELARRGERERAGARTLWLAGLAQIVLLWAWHAPALQGAAAGSHLWQIVLLAVLACVSIVFWTAVQRHAGSWQGIAALLATGKLACLLGALLVFAPRDLYGLPGLVLPFCTTGASTLSDQQLAGLLMITACPLSYLVAGVVLAAQMLTRLDTDVAARETGGAIALR